MDNAITQELLRMLGGQSEQGQQAPVGLPLGQPSADPTTQVLNSGSMQTADGMQQAIMSNPQLAQAFQAQVAGRPVGGSPGGMPPPPQFMSPDLQGGAPMNIQEMLSDIYAMPAHAADPGFMSKVYGDRMGLRQQAGLKENEMKEKQYERSLAVAQAAAQKQQQAAQVGLKVADTLNEQLAKDMAAQPGLSNTPAGQAYMDAGKKHINQALQDPNNVAILTSGDMASIIRLQSKIADEARDLATKAAQGTGGPAQPGSAPDQAIRFNAASDQAARDAAFALNAADKQFSIGVPAAPGGPQVAPAVSAAGPHPTAMLPPPAGAPQLPTPPSTFRPIPLPQKPVYDPRTTRPEDKTKIEERYRAEVDKVTMENIKREADFQQKDFENRRQSGEDARKIAEDQRKIADAAQGARAALVATNERLDDTIEIAKRLRDHPGLSAITGKGSVLKPFTGLREEDSRNAQALYEQLSARVFLSALQGLKDASKTGSTGLGALTEREGDKVQNAEAAMKQYQGTPAFQAELDRYIKILERTKGRLTEGYNASSFGRITGSPYAEQKPSTDYVNKYGLTPGAR